MNEVFSTKPRGPMTACQDNSGIANVNYLRTCYLSNFAQSAIDKATETLAFGKMENIHNMGIHLTADRPTPDWLRTSGRETP